MAVSVSSFIASLKFPVRYSLKLSALNHVVELAPIVSVPPVIMLSICVFWNTSVCVIVASWVCVPPTRVMVFPASEARSAVRVYRPRGRSVIFCDRVKSIDSQYHVLNR